MSSIEYVLPMSCDMVLMGVITRSIPERTVTNIIIDNKRTVTNAILS